MLMRQGLPVFTLTAAGMVVVASFLPWATLTGPFTPQTINGTSVNPLGTNSLVQAFAQAMQGQVTTFTVSGWTGHVGAQGMTFPNWLIVAAAVFVAAFALMECVPHTKVPRALPLSASVYGLVHLGMLAIPAAGLRGSLHPGYFLALAAFGVLVVSILRTPSPASVTPPAAAVEEAAAPAS